MANSLLLSGGNVYQDGTFVPKDLLIIDGVIAQGDSNLPSVKSIDVSKYFIIPGMIDIHTHGAIGIDFNLFHSEADLAKVIHFFATKGVSGLLPTVLTDEVPVMKAQLSALTDPQTIARYPQILGIHLEGPFLNPAYKGAMKEELLSECDLSLFDELQEAAHGMISLITLAPETKGCTALIKELNARGVRVSLGHSGASYEEAIAAIEAGAQSTTHTMNAMKLLHMHDPAILTAVLEQDIYAEMICDGFHLHPPIIRLLLKTKGWDRMIAVSDSIMAAGYPDGEYLLGPNRVIVKDGDAKLTESGVRAGSTLTMDTALRNLLHITNSPLEKVVPLVSTNASSLLGLANLGDLRPTMRADLTILDEVMDVVGTITGGVLTYWRD